MKEGTIADARKRIEGDTKKVILSPRGTKRREVAVDSIQIPDLWHIAMFIKEHEAEIAGRVGHNHLHGKKWSAAILETWYLCHDLLDNIAGRTMPQ